jgi:ABC-type transport system substrate-binding protein
MAFGEPLSALDAEYKPDSAFASYATKESAAMLAKTASELDASKREQLTREMGQKMRDEASGVFLVYANEPYGASKKVGQWPTIRLRPQNIDLITHQ